MGFDEQKRLDDIERLTSGLQAPILESIDDSKKQYRILRSEIEKLKNPSSAGTQNFTTIQQSVTNIETISEVSGVPQHGIAGESIAFAEPCYMNQTDRKVYKYTSNIDKSLYMGLSTNTYASGDEVTAQKAGGFNFDINYIPNKRLFVDNTGTITQENPDENFLYIGIMKDQKKAVLSSGIGYTPLVAPKLTATTVIVNDIDLQSTTPGSAGCSRIGIPALSGASWTDQCQMNSLFGGAGRVSGGAITDTGSQTVATTGGTGFIKATDDDTAELISFNWSGITGTTVPTDKVRYMGVEYNAGSPQIVKKSTNTWDLDTEFPLGSIINQSDDLYVQSNPWWISDGLTNVIERFQADGYVTRDNYVGGLIIGVTGTRNPTITGGTCWSRLNEFDIDTKDCSGADRIYTFYRKAGGAGWNRSAELQQYPVDQYDDGSGTLQDLDNNKYANWWVFLEIDSANNGQLMYIYPQNQYNTAAGAEAESVPTLPTSWYEHGILVGRVTFKKNVDAPVEVASSFEEVFSAALAADHANLSNLNWASAGHTIDTDFDLAGNNILNGGTITATTVSTANLDNDGSAIAVNDNLELSSGSLLGLDGATGNYYIYHDSGASEMVFVREGSEAGAFSSGGFEVQNAIRIENATNPNMVWNEGGVKRAEMIYQTADNRWVLTTDANGSGST